MQDFLYFKDKMLLLYQKFVTSGIGFEKFRPNALTFMSYLKEDFPKKLAAFEKVIPDLEQTKLENVIGTRYKFLLKGTELRNIVQFVTELEQKINDFKGKENNLRVVIGIYFLYLVLVVKLVDVYWSAMSIYAGEKTDISNKTLDDIGIDNTVLKYFIGLEDLRVKTLDDWLKASIDDVEERYFSSATKRILMILGNEDKKPAPKV